MDTLSNQNKIDISKPDLWLVAKERVPEVWQSVLDLLSRTPDDGALANWEPEELYELLVGDTNYFLCVGVHGSRIEAVMILVFDKYPNDLILRINSGNGPIRKYMPYLEKMERWAFSCGCSGVEVTGGKGLQKLMNSVGYQTKEYRMVKPIRKMWSN